LRSFRHTFIKEIAVPVVFKTDSDGVAHQVWIQEQAATCAVASIWMARNQAMQMTYAEGEWSLAWRLYSQVVNNIPLFFMKPEPAGMTFDPRAHLSNQNTLGNMFSQAGTFATQVARALQNDGLKTTVTSFATGTTILASKITDTTPAIVLLGWYNGPGSSRNGGHFIVASRATKSGKIVYLDPWNGQLSELGLGPNYGTGGMFEQVIYISR